MQLGKPMNILPLSDLHLERHHDGGEAFISSIPCDDVDVLVLAGDITCCISIADVLAQFCERFKRVVYVPGNHEYYNVTQRAVRYAIAVASVKDNLFVLDYRTGPVTIDGVRFLGGTMWFRKPRLTYLKNRINDFEFIRDFEEWVYKENRNTTTFLEREIACGDVVVTHHLPSKRSVDPWYEGDPANCFFVCEMDEVIERSKPQFWIHGHTHSSVDASLGATRVVCNPYGYPGAENAKFDIKKIVTAVPSSEYASNLPVVADDARC